jgi:hypothetical protein
VRLAGTVHLRDGVSDGMSDERNRFRFSQYLWRGYESPSFRQLVVVAVVAGASGPLATAVLHLWPSGWITLLVIVVVLAGLSVPLAIWRRHQEDVRYIEYLEAEDAARERGGAGQRDDADAS